jgi:hypothetical protein
VKILGRCACVDVKPSNVSNFYAPQDSFSTGGVQVAAWSLLLNTAGIRIIRSDPSARPKYFLVHSDANLLQNSTRKKKKQ